LKPPVDSNALKGNFMSMLSEAISRFRHSRLAEEIRPAFHGAQSAWRDVARYPLYLYRFGLERGSSAYEKLHGSSEKESLTDIRIPQVDSDISLRSDTADVSVFEQIFLDLEYGFELPSAPTSIIDAGAHIGLASLYFAHRFPQCDILALEPEPGNFQLLKENTRSYSSITPIQAGLWGKSASLELGDVSSESWCFQVQEQDGDQGGIPAMTVLDAMNHLGVEHLDVLKMDIEGAEQEVLENCRSWIDSVGTIIVELHGKQRIEECTAIQEAIRCFDVEKTKRGENVVLTRK
jgi:FkbM family methyltransferase